ncbi:beta-ketoacyl-ACP synthase III [Desulfoplanes formicivorans]|uniref:Beta-ketoacyl-[acyl-carrier-protein] synthase III n=1 Tax=Desulfoplanes formicivorans TaxID=1592317 RepID=A0A194AFC1_9BACT|nr:beta-ketoacyl-ACP synthase III [Desulfoplanes formicivorans]GAU07895.1 3-oxoacyl-ACP synthase [Desulfoplanes formicivorans]
MPGYTSIMGLGYHVPERILTNEDLEKTINTSDEWITSRTGIKTRHIAPPQTGASVLALEAATKALADAGLTPADLTHIIVPTFTPDYYVPSTACILQHKLGIPGIPAMDVFAACSGFLYGLEQARALVALYPQARVLVAASEIISSRTDFTDRSTCVLFGDGAGAAIVGKTTSEQDGGRILDVLLSADGSLGDLLTVKGGGSACPAVRDQRIGPDFFIQMEGRDVFKHAVRSMACVCNDILAKNQMTSGDVDLIIPHQANIRIIQALGRKLDISMDRIFVNVDRYGNTSAASIPIALAEAKLQGRIAPGDTVLLTSFGGGFTWASALIRF